MLKRRIRPRINVTIGPTKTEGKPVDLKAINNIFMSIYQPMIALFLNKRSNLYWMLLNDQKT